MRRLLCLFELRFANRRHASANRRRPSISRWRWMPTRGSN
jgi:hypothetical protein